MFVKGNPDEKELYSLKVLGILSSAKVNSWIKTQVWHPWKQILQIEIWSLKFNLA